MAEPVETAPAPPLSSVSERLLALYLRGLAAAFLFIGITYWLEILSLPSAPQGALLALPFSERAELIAYAVLDPIAAVGLWLTASWGVVVWLLLAGSRLVIASELAGEGEVRAAELALHVASITVYIILWQVARRAAARRD